MGHENCRICGCPLYNVGIHRNRLIGGEKLKVVFLWLYIRLVWRLVWKVFGAGNDSIPVCDPHPTLKVICMTKICFSVRNTPGL